jgi:uncharacterized HhH-GPD family protein
VPERLYFTEHDEANELLARDPFALLVGFALDQQVTVPTAFAGPWKLQQRLGTLEPATVAALDEARLEEAMREKPAVHRFPGAMASRVRELAGVIAEEYGGDAARVWAEAADTADLKRRIGALPGFGEMKVKALASVLSRRFGLELAEPLVPSTDDRPVPTLGDVDSPDALQAYQAAKRAYKAQLRAAKA